MVLNDLVWNLGQTIEMVNPQLAENADGFPFAGDTLTIPLGLVVQDVPLVYTGMERSNDSQWGTESVTLDLSPS
jgi:hypothetical protein